MSVAALWPESWPLPFVFWLFISFYVGSGSKSRSGTGRFRQGKKLRFLRFRFHNTARNSVYISRNLGKPTTHGTKKIEDLICCPPVPPSHCPLTLAWWFPRFRSCTLYFNKHGFLTYCCSMQLPLEIESNQMFYVISLLDSVHWKIKLLTFLKKSTWWD
jgi:hypothetical protein